MHLTCYFPHPDHDILVTDINVVGDQYANWSLKHVVLAARKESKALTKHFDPTDSYTLYTVQH